MTYDPEKHHRRSIRLKNYDYSQPGAYFVTLCTQKDTTMFGDIIENEMCLNDRGEIAQTLWKTLPERFPTIELDYYIIMPNHLHGIIVQGEQEPPHVPAIRNHPLTQPARSELGQIIRTFKAATTRLIRISGTVEFAWHQNYHEHIVRNERDLERIRQYIVDNPARWAEDEMYRGPTGA